MNLIIEKKNIRVRTESCLSQNAKTRFQAPPKDELRRQKMLLAIIGISVILVSVPNLVVTLNEWKSPKIDGIIVGESNTASHFISRFTPMLKKI